MDRVLISIIVALSVISISVVIGVLKYVIIQKKTKSKIASVNENNEIISVQTATQVNLKDISYSNNSSYEDCDKKLKEILSKKSHTALNDIDGKEIKGYKIQGGNNKYKNLIERRVA